MILIEHGPVEKTAAIPIFFEEHDLQAEIMSVDFSADGNLITTTAKDGKVFMTQS